MSQFSEEERKWSALASSVALLNMNAMLLCFVVCFFLVTLLSFFFLFLNFCVVLLS